MSVRNINSSQVSAQEAYSWALFSETFSIHVKIKIGNAK